LLLFLFISFLNIVTIHIWIILRLSFAVGSKTRFVSSSVNLPCNGNTVAVSFNFTCTSSTARSISSGPFKISEYHYVLYYYEFSMF